MNQIDLPVAEKSKNKGFENLILVITLLLLFLMASRSPVDSDLWWHLQSGRVMVETGRPLLTDIFSYTREGQVWVNHSWLSEVLLFGLFRVAGWTGISTLMGLMAVLLGAFLWKLISGGVFIRSGFILLAGVCSAPLMTPRPQFFSLVFLAILMWLVDRWFRLNGKQIWFTVPLFILWSNLHGGYMLGILFLLASSAGFLLDAFSPDEMDRRGKLGQAGILAAASITGYVAAGINPNGFRMWLIPFQTVGVDVLRQLIQEWASPDFHSIETWPFAFYLIFLLFCLAIKNKRIPLWKVVPALLFILLGLYARRNMAVAVIISLPILVDAWNDLGKKDFFLSFIPSGVVRWYANYRSTYSQEFSESKKRRINLIFAGLLGMACFFKVAAVTHPVLMSAFEQKYFPEKAFHFVNEHPDPIRGRLFNSYNWGGYLTWKDPGIKVFVDGRTDLFGDEILDEWITITQAGKGWENLLQKWHVTRVMIEPTRPLASVLSTADWVERYRDSQAVIFDRINK